MEKYITESFAVLCVTGVVADAATGRRLCFDVELDGYVPDESRKPKYVKKKTLERFWASCFELRDGALVYRVFSAEEVNKHGLVWEEIFSAGLQPRKRFPVFEHGERDLRYWLEGGGKEKITQGLLRPRERASPTPTDVIRLVWQKKNHLCKCKSLEELTLHWLSGTVESTLVNLIHERMRRTKFGVEIEFTGVTRERVGAIMADFFKSPYCRNHGAIYDKYMVKDPAGRVWTVMRDASIVPQVKRGVPMPEDEELVKCELVSPLLVHEDIKNYLQFKAFCGLFQGKTGVGYSFHADSACVFLSVKLNSGNSSAHPSFFCGEGK